MCKMMKMKQWTVAGHSRDQEMVEGKNEYKNEFVEAKGCT